MRSPRHYRRRALALLIPLASCERATAPEIRDGIEKAQRDVLANGFSASLDSRVVMMLQLATTSATGFANGGRDTPVALLDVIRNGEPTRYMATVLERVYLPPVGFGGRPYIRRTLLAGEGDQGNRLAVVLDDSVGTIAVPTYQMMDEQAPPRIFGRRGFVVESRNRFREYWYGTTGSIELRDLGGAGKCPPQIAKWDDEAVRRRAVPGSGSVECETARYSIQLRATVRMGDPNAPGASGGSVARLLRPDPSLSIPGQTVSGIRFITQCEDPRSGTPYTGFDSCHIPFGFWRDNSQFAVPEGMDVARLQADQARHFWYELAPGSGPAVQCCNNYPGPVRYTVTLPDGTVFRTVTDSSADRDPFLLRTGFDFFSMRVGGRFDS